MDYLLPSALYDLLKKFVQVVIPGFGTLYFALADAWDLPNADAVVATCAAVAVFLGLLLQLADRSYDKSADKFDGVLQQVGVDENGVPHLQLTVNDPYAAAAKDSVLLKSPPPVNQAA